MQKVDTFLPDLIFMDIRLPGESGLKLTKKIKATHPNIAILILSSYDKPEYREATFRFGADRFLVKTSLNPVELEASVKSYQKVEETEFFSHEIFSKPFCPNSAGFDS